MGSIQWLLEGFIQLFTFNNLLYLLIGSIIGVVAGVLPGIGSTSGMAIVLPLTYGMDPTSSLIMLAGIYYGNMYGGAIPTILVNIPGGASSAMTALDGYQMTRQGEAGRALGMSNFASFVGGMVSTLLLIFSGIGLAKLAINFTPVEYFSLTVLGLTLVSGITEKSALKGYLMMLFGLFLGTVGVDLVSGQQRFVFNNANLLDGIKVIPVIVGLFGFSEILFNIESTYKENFKLIKTKVSFRSLFPSLADWKDSKVPIIRGTIIGFFVGILPGAGATIATVLSYGVEKKASKHPEKFGKGAIEGVASVEAANNASVGGALVPMLALGIPGSASTAILLSALVMFGLRPGPQLFSNSPDVVWTFIASMFIGNVITLAIMIFCIPLCIKIMQMSEKVMLPSVAILCIIGAYCLNNNLFDVGMMMAFGFLGYFFKKLGYSSIPLILGLILGPLAETSIRQSLIISGFEWSIFFTRPISCSLLVISLAVVVYPLIKPYLRVRKTN